MLISSQRYINDEIVAEKIANQDFEVQVSPEFEVGGLIVRVVTDGHHSLAAAIQAGVTPVYCEQDASENDTVGLLDQGRIEDFLGTTRIDSDYYDVATGMDVW